MKSFITLILSVIILPKRAVNAAATVCALCGTPGLYPTNLNLVVKDNGQTCLDLYIDLTPMNPNSQQCRNDIEAYRDECCGNAGNGGGGGGGGGGGSSDGGPGCYRGQKGDEPECPICGTYEYPGNPDEYIQARYVGEFSCGQFYQRGLNGLIPAFMCGPLQNFAIDVCGCGRHNPKCKQDSSQCWNPSSPRLPDNCGQPNPSPVRAPNPAPVSPPVSMPVTEVNPTAVGNRKIRPNLGNKNGSRMAGGARGGSAGALRFGNRQLKGEESS